MLRYLPNGLTCLRLVLTVPLGVMILREQYAAALLVGILAGVTDALDGFFARRLNAFSRFGAMLDPIADKLMIAVCFICCAMVGLLPWQLAAIVVGRDLVIVSGAASYRVLYGPFQYAATVLSKANMLLQVAFLLLVLSSQVITGLPDVALQAGAVIVALCAIASGLDYVVRWTARARAAGRSKRGLDQ